MDLRQCLESIPAASCTYQEWCNVGMALKKEGYPCSIWDGWSRNDSRYRDGECRKKWETFQREDDVVTGGTIVQMARDRGWKPETGGELAWDEPITFDADPKVVKEEWLEEEEIAVPEGSWDPAADLIRYLETLFSPQEKVGYVVESMKQDGKFVPANRGVYARTAGELIDVLRKCKNRMDEAIGTYNQECGAWIRFNPLDGKGVKNDNVTSFRYALVESDSMPVSRQNAMIRAMRLPVAALVHSGGKSLHAIVRIDAGSISEYRKRVDFLYAACEKNGFALDKQNRNPSRLSRMPGVMRAGRKQFLVATNIGEESFEKWREWYEEQDDSLPNFENLADVWDNLPPLAPAIIDGVLRQGHKMLIAGPSKAGKSFAQIEMAVAIAEGMRWMGWQCKMGRVVYVNFELDRPSCLHRFRDVYGAMRARPEHTGNIDIWNLRGSSMQLDKLAPKLIRRARKARPLAIILDPIYKALTGDENSAEQMALFCNQFDRIAKEVGCSIIYCHHHSKGAQGGKKAMDRASGSGVFARDPDALLDLIELPLRDSHYDLLRNKAACSTIIGFMDGQKPGWRDSLGPDDFLSKTQLMDYCKGSAGLPAGRIRELEEEVARAEHHAGCTTAWRVSCTLREFERPDDRDVYFSWPVHTLDSSGALKDIRPEIEVGGRIIQPRDKSNGSRKEQKAKEERQEIIDAYTLIAADKEPDEDGVVRVTVQDFVDESEEYFGKEMKRASMYKKIRKYGDFAIEDSVVIPVSQDA